MVVGGHHDEDLRDPPSGHSCDEEFCELKL